MCVIYTYTLSQKGGYHAKQKWYRAARPGAGEWAGTGILHGPRFDRRASKFRARPGAGNFLPPLQQGGTPTRGDCPPGGKPIQPEAAQSKVQGEIAGKTIMTTLLAALAM
jgi:hypothetical protein